MSTVNPRHEARLLIAQGTVTLIQLWIHYRGLGGNADDLELDALIHRVTDLGEIDESVLALALEELSSQ
jgi:hypothetical protein